MVSSKVTTVKAYLASLPADRRKTVEAVRKVIRRSLPKGFEEGIQYGMLGWYVPLSRYPDTYNGQPLSIVGLASQKQYISLYLMGVYADPKRAKRFEKTWKASGKKLNMGKSCVRFRDADDLAMDAIVEALDTTVDEHVAQYAKVSGSGRKVRASKTAKKKPTKRKSAATKASPKRKR